MTYYIGSARHDENGRYMGGKAGDQTGQEVATQKMYNYFSRGGWICYRAISDKVAEKLKNAMLTACSNHYIGYNQWERLQVINNTIRTKKPTNCDCSTLVRACVIDAAGKDVGNFTTADEGAKLMNSGLFKLVGKVTTMSRLYDGDILVTAKKGHTAIVTSGIGREQKVTLPKFSDDNIFTGIRYSNTFTGNTIGLSINDGADLKKQRTRVLQHALNLDYKAKLQEDGIFGPKTKAALGKHYVKYGEIQYLITAVEILYYLNGFDPKGVEIPGKFGKGLKKAAGKRIIKADDIEKLL